MSLGTYEYPWNINARVKWVLEPKSRHKKLPLPSHFLLLTLVLVLVVVWFRPDQFRNYKLAHLQDQDLHLHLHLDPHLLQSYNCVRPFICKHAIPAAVYVHPNVHINIEKSASKAWKGSSVLYVLGQYSKSSVQSLHSAHGLVPSAMP